ncbi:hypothetical protein CLF_105273, partial [Clonorchis sinensis]
NVSASSAHVSVYLSHECELQCRWLAKATFPVRMSSTKIKVVLTTIPRTTHGSGLAWSSHKLQRVPVYIKRRTDPQRLLISGAESFVLLSQCRKFAIEFVLFGISTAVRWNVRNTHRYARCQLNFLFQTTPVTHSALFTNLTGHLSRSRSKEVGRCVYGVLHSDFTGRVSYKARFPNRAVKIVGYILSGIDVTCHQRGSTLTGRMKQYFPSQNHRYLNGENPSFSRHHIQLGRPGSIPALVLHSGGMEASHRELNVCSEEYSTSCLGDRKFYRYWQSVPALTIRCYTTQTFGPTLCWSAFTEKNNEENRISSFTKYPSSQWTLCNAFVCYTDDNYETRI